MWLERMKRLLYPLLALCWLAIGTGSAMHPMQVEKVERFKKRIDFDAALTTENRAQAVSTIWPDMLKAPGLADGAWKIAADSTWRANGGVAREWVVRRGAEQVAIVIFVSSDGVAPARDFFISRATENMMVDSPFVKGPTGLGTLAVSMPPGAPPNLIWLFRNICVDVRNIDAQVDITAIARWLQSPAEAAVTKGSEPARPRLPGALQVSSRQSAVGAPVDIRMQGPSPVVEARYKLEMQFDPRVVEVLSQERLAARIRGLTTGRTTLDLYLIDTSTLLTEHSRIELEFLSASRQ